MAVHYQESLKKQCKHMWTFLEVFICGNKLHVFSQSFLLQSFAD